MSPSSFPVSTPLIRQVIESPPHWAAQNLDAWDEAEFEKLLPFVIEKYWSSQESINVFDVVGTKHPNYIGLTWIEFLQKGVRMATNLRLQESNPDYYLGTEVKQPSMLYVSLDSDALYVNGDGNHRTAIARFMFHETGRTMLHGVTVERYRTDREAYSLYLEIVEQSLRNRRPLRIRPMKSVLSRDDTGGWMRERYQLQLEITDVSSGKTSVIGRDQFTQFLESVSRKRIIARVLDVFRVSK